MNWPDHRVEFGDFQTPERLAALLCERLWYLGVRPEVILEPTCGTGAFVLAAAKTFPSAREILGVDVNAGYLDILESRLAGLPRSDRVTLVPGNFFEIDWHARLENLSGSLLVLGNFPWVTNATQGSIGGANLPEKTNFLCHRGLDAITGKANFDISEWMLLKALDWFQGRGGHIAMLCKASVARKVLAHAEQQGRPVQDAFLIRIDAREHFDAAVEACLLVIQLSADRRQGHYDYTVFKDLEDTEGRRVGHRLGLTVGDLDAFAASSFLLGQSPRRWRSGIKHDASAVMELTRTEKGWINGMGEVVDLEPTYLYPLMKGSDVASEKREPRRLYLLVPQKHVGDPTEPIRELAPRTWAYLERHGKLLDARKSSIYARQPRFSIFGVGDYAFRPWRLAICGLYKSLRFRLVAPLEDRPVMFDDTVYYVSFDKEEEARDALERLSSAPAHKLLSSLIFWDEKRPIKTSILNVVDWSRLEVPVEPGSEVVTPSL